MADPAFARRRHHALLAGTALLLMLSGCGGKKEIGTGNDVAMRDMEVIDGTANDSMTNLDAVRTDGVGVANNAGNASTAVQRARDAQNDDEKNAESVAAE